jgi:integrase
MARKIERLSALAVERAKRPGWYADGDGLYLQVTAEGGKSWSYRFMLNRRSREMGLGPLHVISLSEARAKATQCRRMLLDGIDPIEARKAERDRARLEAANSITFKECAAAYIKANKAGWRTEKHAELWTNTMATYVEPIIGALPVQSIDTGLVMRVLEQEVRKQPGEPAEPLWTAKPETAGRVRGRMEAILAWATVRGFRRGENPARWRGHLDQLLPAQSKVAKVEHHAALPYAEIGPFLASLRAQEGIAARALEFAILTAARTGEVIGAKWDEIDMDAKTWTIPAGRMKGGREHRVPLSPAAAVLVEKMKASRTGEFVFPSLRADRPLSNMAMLVLLRRMKREDVTVHGFRSTFRDWAAEQTAFPSEVVEMALAHAVGNKVEAAYRRGDLFEKRRKLMDAWAGYCAAPAPAGKVVAIRAGG